MNISNTDAFLQQLVLDSQLFYKWKRNLESNRVIIERLEILSVVSRDHKSFYAAMIDCDLLTPEGYRIPRCIILRGDSVVVIPVLHCIEDGEIYTLMVKQRRIIDGNLSLEFPGGMLDPGIDDPANMAIIEVMEEIGIHVEKEEIHLLTPTPLKVCESLMDEVVNFFYFEKHISHDFLDKADGRRTGCHEDNEFLQVTVQNIKNVIKIPSFSSFVAINLLERALQKKFE